MCFVKIKRTNLQPHVQNKTSTLEIKHQEAQTYNCKNNSQIFKARADEIFLPSAPPSWFQGTYSRRNRNTPQTVKPPDLKEDLTSYFRLLIWKHLLLPLLTTSSADRKDGATKQPALATSTSHSKASVPLPSVGTLFKFSKLHNKSSEAVPVNATANTKQT